MPKRKSLLPQLFGSPSIEKKPSEEDLECSKDGTDPEDDLKTASRKLPC